MIISNHDAEYLLAVVNALRAGTLPVPQLTARCPECQEVQTYLGNNDHTVVLDDEDDPGAPVAVVIGCEGYWVVDPATVGIDSPNWQDWRPTAQTNTAPTTPLTWETAGTDEPGDQNAESRHLLDGATSAFYSVGPFGTDQYWSLELIQMRDGEQIDALVWPPLGSEADAKATAEEFERTEKPDLS